MTDQFNLAARCLEVDRLLDRLEAALSSRGGSVEYGMLDNAADFATFKRFHRECWPLLSNERQTHYSLRIFKLQGARRRIFT